MRRNPDGEPSGTSTAAVDELCLHINLDYDRAVLLRISPEGHVTTTLSKRFTEWLMAEAKQPVQSPLASEPQA